MVAIVVIATLAAFHAAPGSDTTRSRPGTEIPQEAARSRPGDLRIEMPLFLRRETILDRLLAGQGDSAHPAGSIDSLLRLHPELKNLVLRELLMPARQPEFSGDSLRSAGGTWRLAGNSRMTPFGRSALIKTRQMELHDTWTENRILAPHTDMVATVMWILGLFK